MARPRKDSPAPSSRLVALRLGRDLLAAIDRHARRTRTTRSGSMRDLLAHGLTVAGTKGAKRRRRSCGWCEAAPGEAHLEACPHHPGAPLRRVFTGGGGGKKR